MNQTMQMFNLMKLPEYVPLFKSKRAAILGAGAVGSCLAEILAKMGVGCLYIFDFDTLSRDNIAKCAGMLRPDEDVGCSKAQAVAREARKRMVPGGIAHGIDADLRRFGPMAFADFDAVFLALDNYAAKELFNQLFLQIPPEQRPVVGISGTSGESAMAYLLDGRDFCLRCLFDESWLENGDIPTSCSGPQYMHFDSGDEIVRTSGLASLLAAAFQAEKFRAWVLGDPQALNTHTTYTAYPNFQLLEALPMAKESCPDCHSLRPPAVVRPISGSVLTLTLAQALEQISEALHTDDYILRTHLLEFSQRAFGGFICEEYCHHCGAPVKVYAHEGRVHYEDVLCDACKSAGKSAYFDADRPVGESLRFFRPGMEGKRLLDMTLYDLGYPLGAYLNTVTMLPDGTQARCCFTCAGDSAALAQTERLR